MLDSSQNFSHLHCMSDGCNIWDDIPIPKAINFIRLWEMSQQHECLTIIQLFEKCCDAQKKIQISFFRTSVPYVHCFHLFLEQKKNAKTRARLLQYPRQSNSLGSWNPHSRWPAEKESSGWWWGKPLRWRKYHIARAQTRSVEKPVRNTCLRSILRKQWNVHWRYSQDLTHSLASVSPDPFLISTQIFILWPALGVGNISGTVAEADPKSAPANMGVTKDLEEIWPDIVLLYSVICDICLGKFHSSVPLQEPSTFRIPILQIMIVRSSSIFLPGVLCLKQIHQQGRMFITYLDSSQVDVRVQVWHPLSRWHFA